MAVFPAQKQVETELRHHLAIVAGLPDDSQTGRLFPVYGQGVLLSPLPRILDGGRADEAAPRWAEALKNVSPLWTAEAREGMLAFTLTEAWCLQILAEAEVLYEPPRTLPPLPAGRRSRRDPVFLSRYLYRSSAGHAAAPSAPPLTRVSEPLRRVIVGLTEPRKGDSAAFLRLLSDILALPPALRHHQKLAKLMLLQLKEWE